MRISVRVFAQCRDVVGRAEIPLDLEAGGGVAEMWVALASAHPQLRDSDPSAVSLSTASSPLTKRVFVAAMRSL